MDSRKIVCITAAGFVGLGLVSAATSAAAKPRDVVVTGKRIDPELQRRVSYADLNLALRPDQRVLNGRIFTTAHQLCWDVNGFDADQDCTYDAVDSTDDQVAAAIDRAQRKMAGLPVGPAVAISMVVGAR
jgi:UrcA family protein